MIDSRAAWRKMKEKYGIPDGVCSFSMGERLESWVNKRKAAGAAHDYKGEVAHIDSLLKDYKTYEAALKNAKASKFKGKTPSEQAKSLKDAQAAVHTEIHDWEVIRANRAKVAFPLVMLKQNLPAARAKLNGIAKTDLAALKDFYQEEGRNAIGLYVRETLKQNPQGKLKIALENYDKILAQVDNVVDDTSSTDLPAIAKIYAACKMAVEGLAIEVV